MCKNGLIIYHYYAAEISVEVTSTTHIITMTTDVSSVDSLGVSLGAMFGVIVLITAAAILGLVKILCWKRKRERSMR